MLNTLLSEGLVGGADRLVALASFGSQHLGGPHVGHAPSRPRRREAVKRTWLNAAVPTNARKMASTTGSLRMLRRLVSSVGTSAGWTDPTAPRRRSPARAIAAPVLVPAGNLRTTKRFCS